MPAPLAVMSALLLAFVIGIAMTSVKSTTMYRVLDELQAVIMKVVTSFVIPLLPIYIFGTFLNLGMNDNFGSTMAAFGTVLLLSVVMTLVIIFLLYVVAGVVVAATR